MLSSIVEDSQKSWFNYEPLTLRSLYDYVQNQFLNCYSDYEYIVKCYREETGREIYLITKNHLKNHLELASQNITLLKNAIELWKTATRTSDAVAPILYHYSWHCFNAFFVYSFFRWQPEHCNSHGIRISKWSDDVTKIRIQFSDGNNGLFKRLVDTWSCLGTSLAFSPNIPFIEKNKINFQKNDLYFLKDSNELEVSRLLNFNPSQDFERKYWSSYGRDKLVFNPSINTWGNGATRVLRDYLILFVASSIARYRPNLWTSTLLGETRKQTDFTLSTRTALLGYTQFGRNSRSFLNQLSDLINDLAKGKFEIKRLP